MTAVAFPSEEALIAAITAELVTRDELSAPVRFWRDAERVWVRPIDALSEDSQARLSELGAKPSNKRAPKRAKSGMSWLEAVPPMHVGEPTEPIAPVLFAIPDASAMLAAAGEMLRLGAERQRYRLGSVCLLLVDAPPYYTVVSALEPDSRRRAYRPTGNEGVWMELGFAHPLVDRITVAEGELLLVGADGWLHLGAAGWDDVDKLIDLVLPATRSALVPEPLTAKLEVALRLTRTGTTRPAALWVVRDDAVAQLEKILVDLPSDVVDALLFATGRVGDADVVVLRAREGASTLELALRAERYARHAELPALWLPTDAMLEPPLGRAHLSRLLPDARATCWLRNAADGSLVIEHATDDAFRPLGDWIDYVVSMNADAIAPWIDATLFELDAIERSDLQLAKGSATGGAKKNDEGAADEGATATRRRKKTRRKKKAAKKKKAKARRGAVKASVELAAGAISAHAARAAELEAGFLALASAADSDERLAIWLELGALHAAMDQAIDAGHAFARVLWESTDEAAEIAEAWADVTAGDRTLTAVLEQQWPSREDVNWLVAQLYATDALDVEPARIARFVDAHQEGLDVRTRWLAHVAVSRRAGGDALRLSRARDRALSDLRGGLSLDRDVPGFLRARASGLGDAAVGRTLVLELESLWKTVDETARKRSAIEAPEELTGSYVRRLFAYGFARLGRKDLVASLLDPAIPGADTTDPVHGALLAMFDERIRQGEQGLSPTTPLPAEITSGLNGLAPLDRYKVDRLREVSEVLEPVERLDAISGFKRGEVDPRGDALAALRGLDAGPELSARIEDVVRGACSAATPPDERARLLDGAMDFFYALPVSQATALLEELVPSLEPIAPLERAWVVEEALVLAAHFGHESLIDDLSAQLARLIGEVDPGRAAEIASVLPGALRTLRRVGLRDRAAELLDAVVAILDGDAPELVLARAHVAGGFIYLGVVDRARPLLLRAHARASDETTPVMERLGIIRAVAHAVALLPAEERIVQVRRIAELLPQMTDVLSTNTHFCLSLLHFVESLITGLVPPDRGRDGPAATYLDEDEHLVRRRIHRDLREALESP